MFNRFINLFHLGVIVLFCFCISINTLGDENENPPKCNKILDFVKYKIEKEKRNQERREAVYKFALLVVNAHLIEQASKSRVRLTAYRSFFRKLSTHFTPGEKVAYDFLKRAIVDDYKKWLVDVMKYESRSILVEIMNNNRHPGYNTLLMPFDALSPLKDLPVYLTALKILVERESSEAFDPESFIDKIDKACLESEKRNPWLYVRYKVQKNMLLTKDDQRLCVEKLNFRLMG